jgi:hypothetical protein
VTGAIGNVFTLFLAKGGWNSTNGCCCRLVFSGCPSARAAAVVSKNNETDFGGNETNERETKQKNSEIKENRNVCDVISVAVVCFLMNRFIMYKLRNRCAVARRYIPRRASISTCIGSLTTESSRNQARGKSKTHETTKRTLFLFIELRGVTTFDSIVASK